MYHSIAEFITDWKNESQATQKILDALSNESLNQKVTDVHRTLGRIAWHIVQTIGEMPGHAGLKVEGSNVSGEIPQEASFIAATYKLLSEKLVDAVQTQWTDDMLPGLVNMYGDEWSRASVLDICIKHEIHHRAQLTILMRQAGLRVPGVYGPSYDEWADMGMQAHK
ncbi:MAG TPA: DinB family protein [Candidatus Kapabacteria bacterium]|nr:DinB family protein [Candidatus Kapabacteria bacterium]